MLEGKVTLGAHEHLGWPCPPKRMTSNLEAPLRHQGGHPGRSAVSICLASAVLPACQAYEPAPLGDRSKLLSNVAALKISSSDLPLPEVGAHPFDPSRPSDMDEVAMIDPVSTPDLTSARDQA